MLSAHRDMCRGLHHPTMVPRVPASSQVVPLNVVPGDPWEPEWP